MSEYRKVLVQLTKDEKKLLIELSHINRTNMTHFIRGAINGYDELPDESKRIIKKHIYAIKGDVIDA